MVDRARRRTLQGLVGFAGLGAAGCARTTTTATAPDPQPPPPRAASSAIGAATRGARPPPLVARVRRDGVVDPATGAVDAAALGAMLGAAVARATGAPSPVAACRRLFRPTDHVGIKIGTLAGRGLSPHPELVAALAGFLLEAGVPATQIVIWDRTDDELVRAGFALNRSGPGVRCLGTNDDYDWTPREWGAGGSCFARILVEELTALVNVSVLKDHDLSGISASLKNNYGVVHNPNQLHANGCDPYVAELASYPLLRDKLRLSVVDGLVAQCHGGPAHSPRWAWPWGGLLVSRDPVALDRVVQEVVEERRRELGLPSLAAEGREPRWLATAARLGLGEAARDRITVEDA